jgi:hypothetical protein
VAWYVNADTGATVGGAYGGIGNALGITTDPLQPIPANPVQSPPPSSFLEVECRHSCEQIKEAQKKRIKKI